jgi:hypothetical protein
MAWFSRSGRIVRALLGVSETSTKRRPIRRAASRIERLLLERLEDRVVPAPVTWVNPAGGDWDTPGNWSTDALPGSTANVIIPAVSSPITHSQAINDTVASISTAGNLTLSGGSLTVTGNVSVTSGAVFLLEGGTLANATVSAGSTLTLTNSGGTLTDTTVAGEIDGTQLVPTGGAVAYNYADVSGGLTLSGNGSVLLGAANGTSSAQLFFEKTQTLAHTGTGTGSVVLGSAVGNAVYAQGVNPLTGTGPATLIIGSGITIDGGSGTVGGYYSSDSLVNEGTIDSGSGTIALQGNTVSNSGVFEVSAGATLSIAANTNFTDFSSANSTLTGGTYQVAGTFEFPGAAIATDAATITLDGPSSLILNSTSSADALTSLDAIAPDSSLTLDGSSLTISGALVNQGTVTIDAAFGPTTLTLGGIYTQAAAGTGNPASNTTLIADAGSGAVLNAPSVALNSGTLQGSGTIVGNVTNAALVSPGTATSPGSLSIQGTYTQTSAGALDLQLDGTSDPGTGYSQVAATNRITLNGTIDVSLDAGFTPSLGDSYTVLQFASSTGDFSTKTGFNISSSIALTESFGAEGMSLLADPPNAVSFGVTTAPVTFHSSASQSVTVTASLFNPSGAVNGGTVTFTLTNQSGSVVAPPVVSGSAAAGVATATFVLPAATAVGTYVINASYSGTSEFLASTAVSSLVISPAASTTSITANPTVSYSLSSQVVNLTASVTSPDGTVNEGSVAFTVFNGSGTQIGTAAIGPVISGVGSASFTLPGSTGAGAYTIQESYTDLTSGDFQTSTSAATGKLTVSAASTATVVTPAAVTFSLASQSVTLSAAVASPAGNVNEGTVTFGVFQGTTQIGTSVTSTTVSAGNASASYTLPGGSAVSSYTIDATYNPGPDFNGSSDDTHHLTVSAATTTTDANNASAVFSSVSQSVTLSASITSGAGTVNGGTVTFSVFNGGTQIGNSVTTTTVNAGAASAVYALPGGTLVGTYTIDATYSSGADFGTSTDDSHTLTVSTAGTTISVASAQATFSSSQQSVTLKATVSAGTGTVNEGTVTFSVFAGAMQIGTTVFSGTVVAGAASAVYTLPGGIAGGDYTIDATYTSNGDFIASEGTGNLAVLDATTITAANISVTASTTFQLVTLSATVASNAGSVNTGSVTFGVFQGSTQIGASVTSATVSAGSASANYTLPGGTPGGTYTIQAIYFPGGFFTTSTDKTHDLTVVAAASTTTASSASATFSTSSQTVNLSATVTSAGGIVNEGAVTFTVLNAAGTTIGSPVVSSVVTNGAANVTYTVPANTPIGTYTIQAQYTDSNNVFATSVDKTHTLSILQPVVTFINAAGGDWDTASNWSTDQVPGSTDIVDIPGGTGTVTHSLAINDAVASIISGANIALSAGSLTVDSDLTVSAGADLLLEGGTLADATLIGPTVVQLTDLGGTLSALTVSIGASIDGTQPVPSGGSGSPYNYADVTGGLTLNGAVFLGAMNGSSTGQLFFDSTQTLTGTGSIVLGDSPGNAVYSQGVNSGPATLIINSGISIDGGSGTVGGVNIGSDSLVNDGTIGVSPGGFVTLQAQTATNNGIFDVAPGATLEISSSTNFTNYNPANSTLTGGQYNVGGVFEFAGSITTNAATIELEGPSSKIVNTTSDSDALAGLSSNATAGTLDLAGRTLSIVGTFLNQGSVIIDATTGPALFQQSSSYTQTEITGTTATTVLVSGGELEAPSITLSQGMLAGSGTISGNVTNAATFSPGVPDLSGGTIAILGAYIQTATGILDETVAGNERSTQQFGQISADRVSLNGTIDFSLAGNFSPTLGDTFTIINFTSSSGDFSTKKGFGIGSSIAIAEAFSSTNLTLLADPSNGTSLGVTAASVSFSVNSLSVPVTASVFNPFGTVSGGTVVFSVTDESGDVIVPPVTTPPVASGTASATLTLPAATAVGTYIIQATYSGTSGFLANTAVSSFQVQAGTTTEVTPPEDIAISTSNQTVNLTASVTNTVPGIDVTEGTVAFTLVSQSGAVIGIQADAVVVSGVATAAYTIPANTPAGLYTVQAQYSDLGGNLFLASSDNTQTLTIVSAVVNWINPAGGDWDNPNNWSTGQVPGANDLVTIPEITGTVTHLEDINDTVAGISSKANISLSGGSLTVNGNLLLTNGAVFQLQGGTLANATLDSSSVITLSNAGGTLSEITVAFGALIDGTQPVSPGGNGPAYNYADVSGGLTLNGTIELGASNGSSSAQLFFIKTQNIVSGTGSVVLGSAPNGSNGNAIYAQGENAAGTAPASLIIGEAISIVGGNGLIAGFYSTDSIVNNGTILAAGDGTLIFQGGILSNLGIMQVNAGSTMEIGSDTDVENYDAATGTVIGGAFIASGTFEIPANIYGNDAFFEVEGPSARVVLTGNTGVNALATLVGNEGELDLVDASLTLTGPFSATDPFLNSGEVTIDATAGTAALIIPGPYLETVPSPGLSITDLEGGGVLSATTVTVVTSAMGFGVLEGTGTIDGNVISSGTVRPGQSTTPGEISINGNYTQDATGTLAVRLAGASTPGVSYDTVSVSGIATLAGNIIVSEIDGFTPSLGDSYVIFQFASSNGDFGAMKEGLGVGTSIALDEFFTPGALTLRADPADGTSLGISAQTVTYNDTTSVAVPVTVYVFSPFTPFKGGDVSVVLVNQAGNPIAAASVGPLSLSTATVPSSASGSLEVPVGTPAGTYTIEASFAGATDFLLASAADSSLVILPAATTTAITTPTVTVDYSNAVQAVKLSAAVASSAGTVDEGTVTFTVFNAAGVEIGTAASGPVGTGVGTATFMVPAGTGLGVYSVETSYTDPTAGNYLPSTSAANGTLTVTAATGAVATTTVATLAVAEFSSTNQPVTLSAVVTSSGFVVSEGTVTFTIVNSKGTVIGTPAIGTVTDGTATATYTLPGNTPLGTYTIQAQYSDKNDLFLSSSDDTQTLTVVQELVTWINPAGGDWDTPSNWSTGQVPGPNDVVDIPQISGTVTHLMPINDTVVSLTSAANIALSAGSLDVNGSLSVDAGAVIFLEGGTLENAILTGPTRLELSDMGGTLSGVTVSLGASIDGTQPVPSGGNGATYNYADVTGGLTVNGAVFLGAMNGSSSAQLFFEKTQNLSGSGSVFFGSAAGNAVYAQGVNPASGTGPASLIIGSSVSIVGGDGVIGGYYSTDSVVNDGSIVVDGGGSFTLQGSTLSNEGLFSVGAGGTLSIAAGTNFTNFSAAATTLLGGTYEVAGTFEFPGAAIAALAATVDLDGPSSAILNSTSNTNALSVLDIIAADSGLTLAGTSLTTTGTLINEGSLTIDATLGPATLTLGGSYTQVAAGTGEVPSSTTLLSGGVLNASSAVALNGGTLLGSGEIIGNVANAATVSPGTANSSGSIDIQGTYTQTSAGILDIQLAGSSSPGTNYDQLLAGPVTLSGTINVSLATGYTPSLGDSYTVLQFTSSMGDFSTKKGFGIGTSIALAESFGAAQMTLLADPSNGASLGVTAAPVTYRAAASQPVTVTASLFNPFSAVSSGVVSFSLTNQVGAVAAPPVTSDGVTAGVATASFTLPAGTPAGTYIINASYNGGTQFLANTAVSVLVVSPQSTTTALPTKGPTASYNPSAQTVTLTATVTGKSDTVTEGMVTFTVLNSTNQQVGFATIAPVSAGTASASFNLPGQTRPGVYTVDATYTDLTPGNFLSSSSTVAGTLTIVAAPTTTAVTPVVVPFSATPELVTLTANVTSAVEIVDEGTVAFTVLSGTTTIGTLVSSGVMNGVATANYTLPAGTALGQYTIQAQYTDVSGGLFASSSQNTQTLSVRNATTTTDTTAVTTEFSESAQTVSVSATVTSTAGTVNEGQVTFALFNSQNNPVGTVTPVGSVFNGDAVTGYTLPAGTPLGTYSVEATYTDPTGTKYAASTSSVIGTVVVGAAATSTSPDSLNVAYSESAQNVTVQVNVTSPGGSVNEGDVAFSVLDSHNNLVGTAVAGVAVTDGAASATYVLPAGTPVGSYSLQVAYTDVSSGSFVASTGANPLVIGRASSTTETANADLVFSESDRSLPVSATVDSPAGAVNEGTVTFTLLNSHGSPIDSPVISGTVSGGASSAAVDVPAGTPAGSYTIEAQYNDAAGPSFQTSVDTSHSLVIDPAATATATSTIVASYSATSQTITLDASVTSAAGIVNEGNVVFTLLNSSDNPVGSQSAGGTVVNGAATASYTLPGGTPVAFYSIQVSYTDASPGDFQTSSDTQHILKLEAATTTAATAVAVGFSTSSQNVALMATVSSSIGAATEGTVTFTILGPNKNQIGTAVSGSVVSGSATASFVLPADTPAGTYTIEAAYVDTGTIYEPSTDSSKTLVVSSEGTSVSASFAEATFNESSPPVTLMAAVQSASGPVNEGTVTFTVLNGTTVIGTPVTSATVVNGAASADFDVPGGTAAGTYTILAQYQDSSGSLLPSSNVNNPASLIISSAQTTTSVPPAIVASTLNSGSVILHATVSSSSGMINVGTVTFAVFSGSTPIGTPVTSSTVGANAAKATFTVPADTPAGTYTIQATYNGGPNFLASAIATGTLTLDLSPVLPLINSVDTVTLPNDQFPFTTKLNASSPIGLPLNYTATVVGDSSLFDLQNQYQFQGMGYFTYGAPAYVLSSAVVNSFGNNYYLLNANGGLYAYDGSASYAHSFANGTALATPGANVYTDPTLLLNAQPPVDYTTLYNLEQQYQFQGVGYYSFGATAYVLTSATANSFGNPYYLLNSNGGLFAYDGSGSYAHTFTNVSPLITLASTVYTNPSGLLNAQAPPTLYAQLYQLNQQYDLQELNGSFYTNTYGNEAKWVYSPVLNQFGQHWYTLTLQTVSGAQQAVLTAWEGYQDSEVGAVIATLDPSVYNNPTLLTNATALPAPAVNVTVDNSGNLSIAPANVDYVGTFKVIVTASDGFLSASQTVTVTSTDTAPTLTIQQNSTTIPPGGTVTIPHQSFPQTYTIATTDAENETVTTSASAATFSLPFSLEQQYQFKGVGYYNLGASAYLLTAVGNNTFGNPDYLLSSSGGLYAYDGSGSYAHTFANVTPLATLGASYFEDPTLLLDAQAPVDYTTIYDLQQKYQFQGVGYFTFGATAYVLHSNQPGPGSGGYYLLTANGSLFAYDGSGSYAHAIDNSANLLASVDPSVYVNPSVLLNAEAAPALYSQLNQDEQQFDLQEYQGSFYTGLRGNAAKWLYSPILNGNGQNWYTLVLSPDGAQALLYAYDGGTSSIPAGAQPVATFDSSVYFNPSLLLDAKAPEAATGVTATVSGGSLTINAPSAFVGTFQVTVTATDGALSTTQTFLVASTDTAPVPTVIPPQTASQSGSPLQITLGASSPVNTTLSFSAAVAGYNPAYNLQQVYQFTGDGYFTNNGVTAYVLSSSVLGGVGGYYLVSSTGGVYAYDGSGSYASTLANSANLIAQLSPSVYITPSLLLNAQTPAVPAASATVAGNTLTLNVSGVPVGTVFGLFVTVNDGAESARTGFLVTVTK